MLASPHVTGYRTPAAYMARTPRSGPTVALSSASQPIVQNWLAKTIHPLEPEHPAIHFNVTSASAFGGLSMLYRTCCQPHRPKHHVGFPIINTRDIFINSISILIHHASTVMHPVHASVQARPPVGRSHKTSLRHVSSGHVSSLDHEPPSTSHIGLIGLKKTDLSISILSRCSQSTL
jgi:hypothetical protein